jgi:NAD(P)-dependent dehydrogenase (short-subunit alcohol dehydrogenase family)
LTTGERRWKEGKDVDQGEDMSVELQGKTMVVIGGGSGIGRRIAADAAAAGARVILASRNPKMLVAARNPERSGATIGTRSAGGPTDGAPMADAGSGGGASIGGAGGGSMGDAGVEVAKVDLADEASIVALAERVGTVDYLVSVANSSANGPLTELERDAVVGAFDAKVIGAILLAKHFGPRFADGGAMLLFSGIVGWRPSPGKTVTAATNGAVSFLASALATELAPIRVNAISPGIIDSGAWDGLGEGKQKLFDATAAKVPARRVGQLADISSAAFLALTNPFITGETLHVDGGARYA